MINDIAKTTLDFYYIPKDAGKVLSDAVILGKFFINKGEEKSWKHFMSYCFNLMHKFDEYNGYDG